MSDEPAPADGGVDESAWMKGDRVIEARHAAAEGESRAGCAEGIGFAK